METSHLIGNDGTMLFRRAWRGHRGGPVAFLGHSQPTHSGNLVDLAESLVHRGFHVHAGDFRGHGRSVSQRQPRAHLDADTGWEALVGDFRRFVTFAFEGVPWEERLIVAPNISALATLELLKAEPSLARNIVLISPPPNQKAMWMLARAFTKARAMIRDPSLPDDHTLHHLYTFLGAQIEDRKHLADVTSADRETVDALVADPAAWPTPSLSYWSQIFRGFQQAWDWPRQVRIREGTRVLLMYGSDDPMMGKGGFVAPMSDWFSRRGVDDVCAHRVEGARSALFLDEKRLDVSGAIVRWFENGELPSAEAGHDLVEMEEISSRLLSKLGTVDVGRELSADALVELCYNAVQDETRWEEMLYRIALAIARSERGSEAQIEALVSTLMPHWDRAYELNRQIMRNAALGVVLQDVIERFDIGLGLLDKDFGLVHCNSTFRSVLERCGVLDPAADSDTAVTVALRAVLDTSFRAQAARGNGDALLVIDGKPVGMHFRPQALRQTSLLEFWCCAGLMKRKVKATMAAVPYCSFRMA
jgi:alpha-beta hydrolase superfamily lysophospholipase